jgi:hypothetical protein
MYAWSMSPAHTLAATDLLPDLIMAPVRDAFLETTRDGRHLLRFTAEIVNVGSGPMEVQGSRASINDALMTNVKQRIYNSSGGVRELATPATMSFAGDGHNHWHVTNLERYDLLPIGNPASVGVGAKSGFCFFDNDHAGTQLPNTPAQPQYPGCGTQQNVSVTMGLSIGWGDVYKWDLPDQYIDVTSLPPGEYQLTSTADPDNWFAELNEANNHTVSTITIPVDPPPAAEWRIFLCQVVLAPVPSPP